MPAKKTSEKMTKSEPKVATKKCSTSKCATKKVATKKTAVKASCNDSNVCKVKKTNVDAAKLTRVIAKFDTGWGNSLYIRGAGAGLDWNKGVLMQCVGDDEWLWEQIVPMGDVAFKIVMNDANWNIGEDFVVKAGETIICHPKF